MKRGPVFPNFRDKSMHLVNHLVNSMFFFIYGEYNWIDWLQGMWVPKAKLDFNFNFTVVYGNCNGN
jgi:hypothetical protein